MIPNASDNHVAYLINTLPVASATVNHQLANPRSNYRKGNGMKIIDERIKRFVNKTVCFAPRNYFPSKQQN
jgi:hypothetical protein